MAKEKNKFSLIMVILSIIAVLLGVGVFYWLGSLPVERILVYEYTISVFNFS
jgi:membrane protein DedA with SNARE-associated domain